MPVNLMWAQTDQSSPLPTKPDSAKLASKQSGLKIDQDAKVQGLENIVQEIKSKLEKKEQEDELKKLLEEASQLSTEKKEEKISIAKKFHSGEVNWA